MTSYPLDQNHLMMLNSVIESFPMVRELLEKAKDCGAPCQDAIDTLEEQYKMAMRFKQKFFPNEP